MPEFFIAAVIFLIIAELYFSFFFIASRYGHNYYLLKRKFLVYQYDKLTGYRMRPNLAYSNPRTAYPNAPRKKEFVNVRTDRNGFIFTEDIGLLIKEKQKLIFCLGGSTTAGLESDYRMTYPAQLDKLVRPLHYRCINAGLPAGRSIHELLTLKHRVLAHKPAAVILFTGYNDYECYAYKVYAPNNPYLNLMSNMMPKNAVAEALSYSCLYFLVKRRFERRVIVNANDAKRFQEAVDEPLWLPEWKKNTGEFISLCNQNRIKCFLISTMSPVYKGAPVPAKQFADTDLDMNGRFDPWVAYLDLIHENIRQMCRETGAEFIDVRPFFEKYLSRFDASEYFKERFQLFVDRAHFSEKGNGLLAQAIYEQIGDKLHA